MIIYTLGYTGRTPESIAAFIAASGAFLIDIRFNPHSRHAKWEKAALHRLLGAADYLHVHEFGNVNYRGGPIHLLDPARAVDRLRPIIAARPVALLCACKEWQTCHRKDAAEFLHQAIAGTNVVHISGRIVVEHARHA